MKVVFKVFERENPNFGYDEPPYADRMIAWMADAVNRVIGDKDLIEVYGLDVYEESMPPGILEEVTVYLCGAEFISEYALGSLGVFLGENDLFGEDGWATEYRILIGLDPLREEQFLREEIDLDGDAAENHLMEYEAASVSTLFHELAHAALFAANSNYNSHQAVSDGCEDYDMFDMTTGYGIRDLPDEFGEMITPQSADEARDLMEEWCERLGRRMAAVAVAPGSYYEAMGINPREILLGPSPFP